MNIADLSTVSPPHAEKAYAKVNLNLEVLGRRPDGYHELVSLVAFARDVFDVVTVIPDETFGIAVAGPCSQDIEGDNLIELAAEWAAAMPAIKKLAAIKLIKNLPVAAGLGGGSADAAATLRAIGRLNGIADIEAQFAVLCPKLGADVPVCLSSGSAQGAMMWGVGDKVWRPSGDVNFFPDNLSAVLVNPRLLVPTGNVFRALAAPPLKSLPPPPDLPGPFNTIDMLVKFLQNSRNDLEKPAISIASVIADVLLTLRTLPHCQLARMSGSGATCFGLFADFAEAKAAATRLGALQPHWWIVATRLS